MAVSQPGRFIELWYRWKSLRLPWRRKWLVGRDLTGITFWEMRNDLNPTRARRIAKYPRVTEYSEVALTPAWMQWLRHTRPDAPSITEQQTELLRQSSLKQLAAAADQRWAEKPSMLDRPEDTGQVGPALMPRDPGGYVEQTEGDEVQGVRNLAKTPGEMEEVAEGQDVDKGRFRGETRERPREKKEDPWKKQAGSAGEAWQPQAWTPGRTEKRS